MPNNRTKLQTFCLRTLKLTKKSTITRQINIIRHNSTQVISNNRTVFNTRQDINRNFNNLLRDLTISYNRVNVQNYYPTDRRFDTKVRHVIRIVLGTGLSTNVVRPKGVNIFPSFSNRNPFTRLAFSNHVTVLPQLRVTIITTLSNRRPAVRAKIRTYRKTSRNFLTT